MKTKENELKFLNNVSKYKNRTIAVQFIKNTEQLEGEWEEAQFELARNYQYESINENIWDYYLVFLCSFDQDSLDQRVRFKIENDRFCCRKIFLFNITPKNYNETLVTKSLFPELEIHKNIKIIKPSTLTARINLEMTKELDELFFLEELSQSEISKIFEKLVSKGNIDE